jgi:hypothetical protein
MKITKVAVKKFAGYAAVVCFLIFSGRDLSTAVVEAAYTVSQPKPTQAEAENGG